MPRHFDYAAVIAATLLLTLLPLLPLRRRSIVITMLRLRYCADTIDGADIDDAALPRKYLHAGALPCAAYSYAVHCSHTPLLCHDVS